MNITSDMIYGYTDGIILRCLMDGDSYGYDINNSILKKSKQKYELKEDALYTTFRRLEKQGYFTSYWGEESAGARRRYYSITEKGRAYFLKKAQEWNTMKQLLDAFWG